MTTLTNSPLEELLESIFEKTAELPVVTAFSEEEEERLMRSKTDYLKLYKQLKDFPLAVSRETGELLYMLARIIGTQTIVEFGTSFGVSTLYLAAALRDNGGGLLITSEFEPSKAEKARENLTRAGLIDLVEIRTGDALQTLADGLPQSIDLLLLDGAKALYADILNLVESRLRPGAIIVADDASYCPEYLSRVRASKGKYMSSPLNEDVEMSIRLLSS